MVIKTLRLFYVSDEQPQWQQQSHPIASQGRSSCFISCWSMESVCPHQLCKIMNFDPWQQQSHPVACQERRSCLVPCYEERRVHVILRHATEHELWLETAKEVMSLPTLLLIHSGGGNVEVGTDPFFPKFPGITVSASTSYGPNLSLWLSHMTEQDIQQGLVACTATLSESIWCRCVRGWQSLLMGTLQETWRY